MKRLVISLFTCLFAALPIGATAQSMHNLQALADAAPNSDVYQGQVLWLKRYSPVTGNTQYLSAVRLNKYWGITAGHAFVLNGTTFQDHVVGIGNNWMNNAGETREVIEWITHPEWDGVWNGQKADLAVFRWEEPMPGEDLEIAALSIGEIFEYVGFGKPATPATGYLDTDGQRRAFDAKVYSWGAVGGSVAENYAQSRFHQPGGSQYLPMGGVATGGVSGAPAFNSSGALVGIANAQTGAPGYSSSTYGLRLALYADWIAEKTFVEEEEEDPLPPKKPGSRHLYRCRGPSIGNNGPAPCPERRLYRPSNVTSVALD